MLTGRKWPHADLLEKEKEKEKQGRKEKAKRHSRKNYIIYNSRSTAPGGC